MRILFCFLVMCLAACDKPAPPPASPANTVTFDGLGSVRVGTVEPPGTPRDDACRLVHLVALPFGARAMLIHDTIARIDIDTPGIHTGEGAGVGDAESHVVELYGGRIVTQPHKYLSPTGHYLIVTNPADTMQRIVFETDSGKVLRYRAGRRPAVDNVEGCG